jgi:hypothetical protein
VWVIPEGNGLSDDDQGFVLAKGQNVGVIESDRYPCQEAVRNGAAQSMRLACSGGVGRARDLAPIDGPSAYKVFVAYVDKVFNDEVQVVPPAGPQRVMVLHSILS